MSRQSMDRTVKKCKKCNADTIHIRSAVKSTIGGFFIAWFLIFITCGLYILPLLFKKRKGPWKCERCMVRIYEN